MFQSPFLFPLFFYIFLIPLLFAICLLCVFPQYLLYFYFGGYVLFCFYSRGEFLHAFREKPWNIFPSLNTHPQTDSNPLGAKLPEAPPLVLLFAIECWLFFFPAQLPVQKSMFCYSDWSDSHAGDASPAARCTKYCSPGIHLC